MLLCALGTLAFAAPAEAQVLYGSTASGGAGELFILNPANGAMVTDVGPLHDSGGTNYAITGLAFNPVTGVLYGSTANTVVATSARLVTINPATAVVTVIGPYNAGPTGANSHGQTVGATMGDLAFDAAGNLFGIGTIGGPTLYSVNTATGQATAVGPSGLSGGTAGGGLAISPAGVLFGSPNSFTATGAEFGTYNRATGAYTQIANITTPAGAGTGYAGFAFLGNVLYGDDLGSPAHLVTINTTTGAVTDLGASVTGLDAIAFGVTPVPEPGTVALLLGPAALGLLTAVRRRKQAAIGPQET
jgi:hypothetical protein